jgi:hypothetical protein
MDFDETRKDQIIIERGNSRELYGHPLVVDPADLSVSVMRQRWESRHIRAFPWRSRACALVRNDESFELVRYQHANGPKQVIAEDLHDGRLLIEGATFHVVGLEWTRGSLSTGECTSLGDTPWEFSSVHRPPTSGQPAKRDIRLGNLGRSHHYGIVVACKTLAGAGDRYGLAQVVFDGSGVSFEDVLDFHSGKFKPALASEAGEQPTTSNAVQADLLWNEPAPEGVTDLDFSLDGRFVVTTHSTSKRSVRLWDAESGSQLAELLDHPAGMMRVAFSPTGRHFTTVGSDGAVLCWSTESQRIVRRFQTQKAQRVQVAYSPDASLVAVSSYFFEKNVGGRGEIRIWNTQTGEEIRAFSRSAVWLDWLGITADNSSILLGRSSEIHQIPLLSPEDTASSFEDRRVRWSKAPTHACGFLPDGSVLCVESRANALIAWDHRTYRPRKLWDAIRGTPIAVSRDGRRAAIRLNDDFVGGRRTSVVRTSVWDIASQQVVARCDSRIGARSRWVFSPDGKWLATGSGTVYRIGIPE